MNWQVAEPGGGSSWDPIFTALPIAAGLLIAWWGHLKSKRVDAISAQSGIAANGRAGTAQILEGLNTLIDQLQEDYQGARNDIVHLRDRLQVVAAERDALTLEVARLRKRYGVNGENGPPAPADPGH